MRKKYILWTLAAILVAAGGWFLVSESTLVWPVRNTLQYHLLTRLTGPITEPNPGPTGTLSGTIRDPAQMPVEGAQVLVPHRSGATFISRTDAGGNFTIAGIPPGSYRPVAGAPDPAKGGIYALSKDDFLKGSLPAPMDRGLGALDGLDFTKGGLMLNTQIKGDVDAAIYVHCPGGAAQVLSIDGQLAQLTGPADLAIAPAAGGGQLVVVPELFARDASPGDDEVTVLALPPDFDQGCTT